MSRLSRCSLGATSPPFSSSVKRRRPDTFTASATDAGNDDVVSGFVIEAAAAQLTLCLFPDDLLNVAG